MCACVVVVAWANWRTVEWQIDSMTNSFIWYGGLSEVWKWGWEAESEREIDRDRESCVTQSLGKKIYQLTVDWRPI